MLDAELAILGAFVRTLDPERPQAEAVAVAGGSIVAVGSNDQVRACCGPRTELVDGAGMTVVPGLVDSHQHPIVGAETSSGVDLSAARSVEDVCTALRAARRSMREGEWLRGHSMTYEAFAGSTLSAELIESAVGGAPALLTFFDMHTALASRSALAAAGITGPRTFEDHSEIVCDEGVPTGELREVSAWAVVEAAAPSRSAAERRELVARALREQNAVGITGIHAMDGSPEVLDDYRALEAEGLLTARVVVPYNVDPTTPVREYPALIAERGQHGRLWRAGAAKFFIDGVVESGTAWLFEPDANGGGEEPFWPDTAAYREAVRIFDAAGFQCITHAIGDRAVHEALNAYRDAAAANGGDRRRHRIEHLETLADSDLARIEAEGVIASQQPIHMQWIAANGTDPWSRALGRERAERGFRLAAIRRSGATLALGSDWPVAGYDPRAGMAWARLRRPPGLPSAEPFNPGLALSGLEALEGYTTQAAYAVGEEAEGGRVQVGMRADLTAFADDPVTCDPDGLPDIPVTLTIVDGRIVHNVDA
ncbi:MAG: amidohydrolase [Gaiellales bacterium]